MSTVASRNIVINIQANTTSYQQAMNRVAQSTRITSEQMRAIGAPIQGAIDKFRATVADSNLAAGGITKLGDSTQKTTGKLSRLGESFRGNKGLVFGFAGLSSAAAEGIGMFGMYGDAAERTKEAQDALNIAISTYGKDSRQATQAASELDKQQKFLGMTTRNLMLSQMDQVFFGTMVISQLSEMNLKGGMVGKMVTKLKGGFDAFKGSIYTTNAVAATSALRLDALGASGVVAGGGLTTAGAGADKAAISMRGLGTAVATVAAPLLALKGAMDIIPNTERMKELDRVINDTTSKIHDKLIAEKEQLEHDLKQFDITNLDTWANSISKAFTGVSDESLKKRLAEVNKLLGDEARGLVNLNVTVTDSVAKTDKWKLSMAGINKVMGEGVQFWFPQYITNMKQWRDTIQSMPPTDKIFKMTPDQIQFFQLLNRGNPSAVSLKNAISPLETMGKVFQSVTSSIDHSVNSLNFDQVLKEKMDQAVENTQTGLDRVLKAFHEIHGDKLLGFEKLNEKATTQLNKFLANVASKLDKGGSDGAKAFVESYTKEADSKMKGAARIQFQPIFDYVEKHKGEDAGSWMDGFLQLLNSLEDNTKKSFTQLLIKDKEWKKFGKNSGDSWTKGFSGALDDAIKEANKAAHDIEKALHLSGGSLSFHRANGGIDSFANGGITSAASGLHTTLGPTFLYGDNSGGKETVAFLPHNGNHADRIMDQLDTMFDRKKTINVVNTEGDKTIVIHNIIKLSEDEQRVFTRKYRLQQGRDIASQVG